MPANGSLGTYLRERRIRLDPAALGYAGGQRRTPGLRREEVAQRAGISTTWYSWLEQGRGGPPSIHALDRLAEALMLNAAEREHLFLLAVGRPPEVRYQPPGGALPAAERNVLRLIFLDPRARTVNSNWESVARFVIGMFRGDAARAAAAATVQPLVDELSAKSPDFATMWRESEVNSACEGVRRLSHPEVGEIALEFSAFAVDGRADLAMLVYTPVTSDDAARIRTLAAAHVG